MIALANRPASFRRPAIEQLQQGALVDLELLQWLALDARHDPRNEPLKRLISITAISVPSGLRGVRDRLRSFNFCMGLLSIGSHQRRRMQYPRRRPPQSIFFGAFNDFGYRSRRRWTGFPVDTSLTVADAHAGGAWPRSRKSRSAEQRTMCARCTCLSGRLRNCDP